MADDFTRFPVEPRCDMTDLLVSACGCRAHRGTPRPVDPFDTASEPPGPWVQAAWGGECDGCGQDYDEGDEIRADGSGGWEGKCCENG